MIFMIYPDNILLLINMKLDSKASDNERVKYFYENMYLIDAEKRKELYEKYFFLFKNDINKYRGKCLVQTKKIKEVFKDVLKFMKVENNGNKLYECLPKDYYIYPSPNYFIPFSEGNEDLIYSYLIIVIYNIFCFEKSKPDESKKTVDYYKYDINNFNIKNASKQKKIKKRNKSNTFKRKRR